MEVLRHLGDVEEMRQMRFDRILAEDNPLLERAVPRPGERESEDDVLRSPGGVDPLAQLEDPPVGVAGWVGDGVR